MKYQIIDKNGISSRLDTEDAAWQALKDTIVSVANNISPMVYSHVSQSQDGAITVSVQQGVSPEQCYDLDLIKRLIMENKRMGQ